MIRINAKKPLRFMQSILKKWGVDIRMTRDGFSTWKSLPGGIPRTILDIGANRGQFAARALKALPGVTVHSFEPLAGPFAELQKLANRWSALHCYQFALGDKTEEQTIWAGHFSPASSLLKPSDLFVRTFPDKVPTVERKISVVRLDDWSSQAALTPPVLIKMDVQGYERHVIEGGRETLRRASAILVELSFVEIYEGQPLIADMIKLLGDLEFRLADVYEVAQDPKTGLGFQCDGLFVAA